MLSRDMRDVKKMTNQTYKMKNIMSKIKNTISVIKSLLEELNTAKEKAREQQVTAIVTQLSKMKHMGEKS